MATAGIDPLDFFTLDQMLAFFHSKKTELSCLEQPQRLLNQLRDHNIIPEEQYERVSRMKSRERRERALYKLLDWLGRERPQRVIAFWKCLFADHIVHVYPTLKLIRSSIIDGSLEKLLQTEEKPEESKDKDKDMDKDKEEPGPSSPAKSQKRKRPQKPVYGSPLRKSEADPAEPIWTWPLYKASLPVSCGTKSGTLDRGKLARGESCILSEGQWFTPSAFEEFAGKKSFKNWKLSIRCRNTALIKLIQEGHLTSPGFKRSRRSDEDSVTKPSCVKKKTPSPRAARGRKRVFGSKWRDSSPSASDTPSEEEEEEGDEGEAGVGDEVSMFLRDRLPVTCGSAAGSLQRDRFASGTCGKCIRTEEKWVTPTDFLKEDPTVKEGSWQRSILCLGEPLRYLIERRVLVVHSIKCKCKACSTTDADRWQDNDDDCYVCCSRGSLVCCDECPRAFHHDCHVPSVEESPPGDTEKWICSYCSLREVQQSSRGDPLSLPELLRSDITQYLSQCHYLLLYLYKADNHRVFAPNPCHTVEGYADVIESPMWLDKVKDTLQSERYHTVGQFATDIELIFENCARFNQDNEFGEMGAKLRDVFEEEFKKVFAVD